MPELTDEQFLQEWLTLPIGGTTVTVTAGGVAGYSGDMYFYIGTAPTYQWSNAAGGTSGQVLTTDGVKSFWADPSPASFLDLMNMDTNDLQDLEEIEMDLP